MGAAVLKACSEMRGVGSRVEKLEGQLNRIENNLGTVVDLLQTLVGRVKKLEQKEAKSVATASSKDVSLKDVSVGRATEAESVATARSKDVSVGRATEAESVVTSRDVSPKGGVHGEDDSDSGDDDHREGGASSVPESRQAPVGPSATHLSPPAKVRADRRPKKGAITAPRSPPAAAPDFFSGEETEEEVALSKVPTPKKSRPFANMAMPQKPLAGQDGLWRCNICNISTFRSQVAFDRHWNLHHGEGGLQCWVCSKILVDHRNFRQHMRNQHGIVAKEVETEGPVMGVRKPQFPCRMSGCDTVCSSADSRTTHERRHKETPADKTCSYCSKVYKWKVDRVGHEKVCESNPNASQKVCKFPGCGVIVSTSRNLRKHERTCAKGKRLQTAAEAEEERVAKEEKRKTKDAKKKKHRRDLTSKTSRKIRRGILPRRR